MNDDFSQAKPKSLCVSCTLHVIVEAENGPGSAARKIARKSTLAGGAHINLEKVAREQQIKNRKQMEEILTSLKAKHGDQVGDQKSLPTTGESGINAINGLDHSSETDSAAKDGPKLTVNDPTDQKQGRCGPGEFNKVTGKVDLSSATHFYMQQYSK